MSVVILIDSWTVPRWLVLPRAMGSNSLFTKAQKLQWNIYHKWNVLNLPRKQLEMQLQKNAFHPDCVPFSRKLMRLASLAQVIGGSVFDHEILGAYLLDMDIVLAGPSVQKRATAICMFLQLISCIHSEDVHTDVCKDTYFQNKSVNKHVWKKCLFPWAPLFLWIGLRFCWCFVACFFPGLFRRSESNHEKRF